MICDYCGEELIFIVEFDCSIYYRCPECKTLWDSMTDDAKNEEIMVDVGAMLEEMRMKGIAS
jgi:uncharacterized Zn finger protein